MRSLLGLCTLLLATATSALSTTGPRLLVILDDVADQQNYATFLGDLVGRGFEITYETPRSESLSLFDLGQRKYDHLLFLPTKVKGLGPNLTPGRLVEFVESEGNVLVAQGSEYAVPTSLVGFLAELGVEFPVERTGLVVDHFNYDVLSAPEKHDVLAVDAPAPLRSHHKQLFSSGEENNGVLAVPRAVGHVLGGGHLLTPILRAPWTAYGYNPREQMDGVEGDDLFAAGGQLVLASGFQARNSARVGVLSSAEMMSDAWIEAEVQRASRAGDDEASKKVKCGNREFVKALSGWAFKEIGVLRVNDIEHRLKGSDEANPSIYRIKNEVTYSISLSEYVWDKWTPFHSPASDAIQLEFTMLSPFYRVNLTLSSLSSSTVASSAVYKADFLLPDQHGIFNFRVNYKRPFLTNIDEKRQVSVRHFAHDEWPRSWTISGAWPWVSGIWVTVAGWLMFCAVWMYSRPRDGGASAAGQKKKQ